MSSIELFSQTGDYNLDDFIFIEYELKECSIFDDIIKRSPMVKIATAALAVCVSMLLICATCMCCSFFQLQE